MRKLYIVAVPYDSISVKSVNVFKTEKEATQFIKETIEQSTTYIYNLFIKEYNIS